jgi:ABC-type multidrug transport system fused ATPase/permease subunit
VKLIGLGLLIALWDIGVPLAGGYVIDMILRHQPIHAILVRLTLLFAFGWLLHGCVLPFLLERYDLVHYRVPMLAILSVRSVRAAITLTNGCRNQPIIQQGRDNIARLAERCARDLPVGLRGVAVFLALLVISWPFAPILLTGGVLATWVTVREFDRLEPSFRVRQDAEDYQRNLENEIDEARRADRPATELEELASLHAIAVAIRTELEIDVGKRDQRYELTRRLVFNTALALMWGWGAYTVVVMGYSHAPFLAMTGYVVQINQLFGSITGLLIEALRIGASIDNLDKLVRADQRIAVDNKTDSVYHRHQRQTYETNPDEVPR